MTTSREKASQAAGLPLPVAASPSLPRRRAIRLFFGVLAALLLIPFVCRQDGQSLLLSAQKLMRVQPSDREKLNIILMISDGYGPASETFGRSFEQALRKNSSLNAHYLTPLDRILIGSHRSRSTDSLITDSAAGATAFSCGLKSYNGAIGVDANGKLCGTFLEGAKEKGWLTGVVVTSRLSDATPAAFFAHVPSRAQEDDIANEALGRFANGTTYRDAPLDLAIGGGGCHFLPRSSPYSCRQDEQDLVSASIKDGWHTKVFFDRAVKAEGTAFIDAQSFHAERWYAANLVSTKESDSVQAFMDDKNTELPLLALLAPFNTPYEVDRPKGLPALHSLSLKALDTLDRSSQNTKGFVLMIEGSQIDLCAHSNDPACHAREIGAYQKAIADVTAWVERKNRQGEKTILISTSDHETGGLTLGRQLTAAYPNYAYYPDRLIAVQQSAASLSARLLTYVRVGPKRSQAEVERFVREQTLGARGAAFLASNGGEPAPWEMQAILDCIPQTPMPPTPPPTSASQQDNKLTPPPINTADICRAVIADLVSRRVEVGWSTSGHTGVDVPVHGVGPDVTEALKGNIENTEIGMFIARHLGVDFAKLTKRLKRQRRQAD